ncbi:hypothetical protein [Mesorhizobium sp. 8]|uniref:hypothetical protein n=1 Tax=Mesorhizobium sp. 8 TaxID=2584466 RepID=UPI00111F745D|nr:hypothetical protein [Mesorhizobium sp. 8]QDC00349.1 hypothetical protein FGU64_07935 [Mesorhizobium sp. 8]
MTDPEKKAASLPWSHWLFSAACIAAGVAAFIWGGDLIRGNERATGVIVTVFSILAGFLIAVMTLLGDQSMLPGGWRMGAANRNRIKAKMTRQKWLFCLYLVTLAIIFASSLLRGRCEDVVIWMERVYFGLATTAFALSFGLPWTLMAIQMDRLDAVIESRKAKSSTIDKN